MSEPGTTAVADADDARPDQPGPPARPPQSLTEAIGGPLGLIESVLPPTAFVVAYTASGQDTNIAAAVAVVAGVLLCGSRLVRGQTVRYALGGLVGVALAAFVVRRSGRAEDFFLPGLLLNAGYAAAYLVSILIRWPLIGVIVAALTQRGGGWRKDPVEVRAFTRATWVWVGLFLLRLAVQLPLYLAGAVVALGVARVAMGVPLFAVGAYLSWLLVRGTHTATGSTRPAPAA